MYLFVRWILQMLKTTRLTRLWDDALPHSLSICLRICTASRPEEYTGIQRPWFALCLSLSGIKAWKASKDWRAAASGHLGFKSWQISLKGSEGYLIISNQRNQWAVADTQRAYRGKQFWHVLANLPKRLFHGARVPTLQLSQSNCSGHCLFLEELQKRQEEQRRKRQEEAAKSDKKASYIRFLGSKVKFPGICSSHPSLIPMHSTSATWKGTWTWLFECTWNEPRHSR